MTAFSSLASMGATIPGTEAYFGGNGSAAGLFTAGYALQGAFHLSAWASPAAGVVSLIVYGRLRFAAISPRMHLLAMVLLALSLLSTLAVSALSFSLDIAISQWRNAVFIADLPAASAAKATLTALHETAQTLHATAGISALTAVVFAVSALVPGGRSAAPSRTTARPSVDPTDTSEVDSGH